MTQPQGEDTPRESVSLFLVFKAEDTPLIQEIVQPAIDAGLLEITELVPSNTSKIRMHDHLLLDGVKGNLARKLQDPRCVIFVCSNEEAARAVAGNLDGVLGGECEAVVAGEVC